MNVLLTALALFMLASPQEPRPAAPEIEAMLMRVKDYHGGHGPWAVVGYRIGERSLEILGLSRNSHDLEAIHFAPEEVQYRCVTDGLAAATGCSPGKLNLRVETARAEDLRTVVKNRKTGQTLVFRLKPELVRSILNLPHEQLAEQGRRVALLSDDALFTVEPRP
jgi:formylmethanofuran dehydrogenase subunit E